jgi:transposase
MANQNLADSGIPLVSLRQRGLVLDRQGRCSGTLASLFAAGYLPDIWTPDVETERKTAADRAKISAGPASHTDQERSARNPACPSDPEVSSRRSVQSARAVVALAPKDAGRRTRGNRPASARTRSARRGPRPPRSRDRPRDARRQRGEAAADDHRRQSDSCGRASWRRLATSTDSTILESWSAISGSIRVCASRAWAWLIGRISKAGRSHARAMLVEAAWAAAKAPGPLHAFFRPHQGKAGTSDRRGGRRPQTGGSVLACADERTELSVGAARPGRQQGARHGAPGRPTT